MPRPDTETVVELALELLRADGEPQSPLRIADLGTGSGAILLALLSELPTRPASAPTSQRGALQTARSQCRAICGLATRATSSPAIMQPALSGPFDLIVSNPPYIRSADIADLATEVRDHDPLARSMAAPTVLTPTAR